MPPLHDAAPGRHILIVDDDEFIREPLRNVLEEEGYQVTEARCGREAIEQVWSAHYSGYQFSLVLTDFDMPEGDGRAVARAIKRAMPNMPVVILTSGGRSSQTDFCMPEVDRVLLKPAKLAELRRVLCELAKPRIALAKAG